MRHLRLPVLTMSILVLLPTFLAAQQDRLTFARPAGEPTGPTRVTYTPNDAQAVDAVQLRARLRYRNDGVQTRTVVLATLERQRDGFVGSFVWPDSVVFMVLAVSSKGATRPDTNDGRFWELLATNDAGAAKPEAMWQRVLDRAHPERADWEGSLAAAREFAAAYPDAPESWFALWRTEETVLGPARSAASIRITETKFHELNSRYAPRLDVELSTAECFASYWQGRDSAAAAHWSNYIFKQYPNSDFAQRSRFTTAMASAQTGPAALAVLDTLWARDSTVLVASAAYRSAAQAKDPAAMRRWAARLIETSPQAIGVVAADYLNFPELAQEGVRLLEQRWTMLQGEDSSLSILDASESAIRDARTQARASVGAALARAVMAQADTTRAAQLFTVIAPMAWNTRTLADAAALSVRLGDTVTAVRRYARAMATGTAPPTLLASAEAAIPGLRTRSDFQDAHAAARKEYAARIRENEVNIPLDFSLQVTDSTGRPIALSELGANRPLILAFWSPNCQPSIRALPELAAFATAAEAKGARFIGIVADEPTPDIVTRVTALKLTRPQYYRRPDLGRALGQWRTPDVYIIDSEGILRFAHSDPARARTEFDVLLEGR